MTTVTRSEALPDIPTMNEFVPGYEASNWYGLGAPKGTPADVVEKLNKEINASLGDPNIRMGGNTGVPDNREWAPIAGDDFRADSLRDIA